MAGTLNPWLKAQSDELPGQLGQDFTKRGSPPLSVVRCPLRPYPIAERCRAPGRRPGWAGLATAHNGQLTTDNFPKEIAKVLPTVVKI